MNLKLSETHATFHLVNMAFKQAEIRWHLPIGSVGTSDNLSDSKLQQQTEQLANRHSRLLAVLPAGVIVLDGEGYVQEANRAAIDLLGEPLQGERWITIIQRAFQPQPGDGHDVSLRDGRMVHISTSPLDSEPGQLVLLQDVTETRVLQNKVTQMQRLSAMGEVSARLAHQIRTPLSSALLYLAPLLKDDVEFMVRQRFASKLKHSLTHMEQLVKDMLVFSGGAMAAPSPVVISQLLDDIIQQFFAHPEAEQFQFSVDNTVADSCVYGSREALSSAVTNLLNNARQACGDAGNIAISAVYAEDEAQHWIDICVSDNGPGIATTEQENILRPFYTTRSNGTGLGLAVVQSIANAHRGRLLLESQQGKGSVFSLRLPAYQMHRPAAQAASV